MADLYSVEFEKFILSCLLKNGDTFLDTQFLKGKDMTKMNGRIYDIMAQAYETKGAITPIVIAERIKSLGINLENVEPLMYLDGLMQLRVDLKAAKEIAKKVKKLSVVREIITGADKLKAEVSAKKDEPLSDILKMVDKHIGQAYSSAESTDDEPINLYDHLEPYIETLGNEPKQKGYTMPFPLWNEIYGGLRKRNVYCTASRSGQGKSTLLSFIADAVANDCNPDLNIKVLFWDTEMSAEDQMARMAAFKIGCPYDMIEDGTWRKSEEWFPKVREALKKFKEQNRNFFFKQVKNSTIADVVNITKKWYYKNVGALGNGLVIYDYLKVMANERTNNSPEWQLAPDKMQILKTLAEEIDVPVVTAVQVNRSGITTNKTSEEMIDDESVLSQSGRLVDVVAFMGILRRKTPDEIASDGPENGTHKLIELKSRYQGKSAAGHHNLVKIIENKKVRYKTNYICYDFNNFKVTEKQDLRAIVKSKGKARILIADSVEDKELL